MGLISIRPSTLRASRQDPTSLRIGSSLVAGCVVVAFIGVPLLVLLAIVALLVQPGDGILTPALVALAVVACCWVATLIVGIALTVAGRRDIARAR